jgi:hypothetical protein
VKPVKPQISIEKSFEDDRARADRVLRIAEPKL